MSEELVTGNMRTVVGLVDFYWAEFSAAVKETGGTTHPYTIMPGRWCDKNELVGGADFSGAGDCCTVFGTVPAAFMERLLKHRAINRTVEQFIHCFPDTARDQWVPHEEGFKCGHWYVERLSATGSMWKMEFITGAFSEELIGALPGLRQKVLDRWRMFYGTHWLRHDEALRAAEDAVVQAREKLELLKKSKEVYDDAEKQLERLPPIVPPTKAVRKKNP